MKNIKYVIIDETYPIIFSEAHQHSSFRDISGNVTSAGFCSFQEVDTPVGSRFCQSRIIQARCYGESVSLNIKSDPEKDAIILTRLFNS